MTGEINRDFYCSADAYNKGYCGYGDGIDSETAKNQCYEGCQNYHRKHPTPEQFKEEYGHEYPDDAAVYCQQVSLNKYPIEPSWHIFNYAWFKENRQRYLDDECELICVCACTPWGKPPADWSHNE